ncbi:MAG: signal peptide peptidase SppA [Pseudomonadota bacterium]
MSDEQPKPPQNQDPWTQGAARSESASAAEEPGPKKEAPVQENWERDLVNRLAFATINEQRRSRRWNIFFKFLLFAYLFALLFYIPIGLDTTAIVRGKHTALIEVPGVIAENTQAGADSIVTALRDAFDDKNTAGIILRINSPGGSPVQAGYVYDEINRLKALNPDVPVYAVVTDICASGGYYIAAAADEIYADKASIVGSIGVIMNGFGFVGSMEKLGIERRLLTAGESKGMLDPFSPVKEDEVRHIKGMLEDIHQQFIDAVKKGRGERLGDSPDLYTGLIWTGEQALELGLVDGLGSTGYVAREIIGAEDIVDFTIHPDYWQRFADRIGMTLSNTLLTRFSGTLQ